MGLAQLAVAFDHTVTTAFGECLTQWGFIEAVIRQGLALRSTVAAIRCERLTLWGAVATVGCQNLALWRAIGTVLNQAFFFQAITTAFSQGLTLWGTVRAVRSNGLAEYRVAGFHLWGCLIGSRQGKSGTG